VPLAAEQWYEWEDYTAGNIFKYIRITSVKGENIKVEGWKEDYQEGRTDYFDFPLNTCWKLIKQPLCTTELDHYQKLKDSGMLFELYPGSTGVYVTDTGRNLERIPVEERDEVVDDRWEGAYSTSLGVGKQKVMLEDKSFPLISGGAPGGGMSDLPIRSLLVCCETALPIDGAGAAGCNHDNCSGPVRVQLANRPKKEEDWYVEPEDKKEEISYVFNELKYLEEIREYIDSTYGQHYAANKGKIQTTQLISKIPERGLIFCTTNILKYGDRFGLKEGYNRKDLLKIIHYGIIGLSNLDEFEKEEI